MGKTGKIKIFFGATILAGTLILTMGAIGVTRANHINYGDIQQVINNYPPGKIIFNSGQFPNEPFSDKLTVDIRPFCFDPEDHLPVCEDDWHVLAIRISTPVFIPKFGPLDDECIQCLFEVLQFIPASKPREAIQFLNDLKGEFCLDSRPAEAICPRETFDPEPEAEFCLNGLRFDADRAAVKRFIAAGETEEWEGVRGFCGCEATVQSYAAQWYNIVEPFDPRLSPGEHTFEAVLSYFDLFSFNLAGSFTVLDQEAPECRE